MPYVYMAILFEKNLMIKCFCCTLQCEDAVTWIHGFILGKLEDIPNYVVG